MTKNILVLGGAGYIGAHAALILKEKGFKPFVYDNLSTGHTELVSDNEFIKADIADIDTLKKTLLEKNIYAVMHFAASSLVEESTRKPLLYYRNNVKNAITLFEAMNQTKVNKIIFSSSAAVYGEPSILPITEDHQTNPLNTYGKTKLMIEQILFDLSKAYGLQYVSLRYFNAAGAYNDGTIGEWHTPESHLIPLVLDAALGKREDIKIFGTDYSTPDGTCIRDYVHVEDLIEAHIAALNFLNEGNGSGIFNLGYGKGHSILEVIDAARAVCNVDITFQRASRREGDPAVLIASRLKAKEVLGWEPKITDIKDIVASAWKWHKKLNKQLNR